MAGAGARPGRQVPRTTCRPVGQDACLDGAGLAEFCGARTAHFAHCHAFLTAARFAHCRPPLAQENFVSWLAAGAVSSTSGPLLIGRAGAATWLPGWDCSCAACVGTAAARRREPCWLAALSPAVDAALLKQAHCSNPWFPWFPAGMQRCLCTGEKGVGRSGKPLHFKGSTFHRVIPQASRSAHPFLLVCWPCAGDFAANLPALYGWLLLLPTSWPCAGAPSAHARLCCPAQHAFGLAAVFPSAVVTSGWRLHPRQLPLHSRPQRLSRLPSFAPPPRCLQLMCQGGDFTRGNCPSPATPIQLPALPCTAAPLPAVHVPGR